VLIERDFTGFRAHAWREPLKVSRSLAAEFPELRSEMSRARLDDPRQRMPMTTPLAARGAPIAALAFLSRGDRHSVRRMGPLAALAALIRQSPWVIVEDAWAGCHLDALRDAAAGLSIFQIQHTPAELHTIARVLTQAAA
jgi:hypothetical protein